MDHHLSALLSSSSFLVWVLPCNISWTQNECSKKSSRWVKLEVFWQYSVTCIHHASNIECRKTTGAREILNVSQTWENERWKYNRQVDGISFMYWGCPRLKYLSGYWMFWLTIVGIFMVFLHPSIHVTGWYFKLGSWFLSHPFQFLFTNHLTVKCCVMLAY